MSRERRSRVLFSVLAAAALTAVPAGPSQAQDAKPGTLSIGFESGVQHFDPALAYDVVGIPLVHAMFDTLVGYDKDLNIVPSLAAEMPTISADGLTYTFKLRPGVQFVQNGTALREMTADDVVYSLNRLLQTGPQAHPIACRRLVLLGHRRVPTWCWPARRRRRRASRRSTTTPSRSRSHTPTGPS